MIFFINYKGSTIHTSLCIQVPHVQHGAVISLGYVAASRMTERQEEEGLVAMDTGTADTRLKLTVSAIERLGELVHSCL